MLEQILQNNGRESGFYKHKLTMPQAPSSNRKIIAIQIILGTEPTRKPAPEDAQELFTCLSVIDQSILAELKKLLPDS